MTEGAEKKSILIVDDIPDNIDVLAELLKSEYNIKVALSGDKALDIASADPKPEVILLDVMMPGIDGFETCRQLKSNPDTRNIEVIFVSAMDSVEDIVTGYEAGGSDYLTKPIKPEEVIQKVQLCIKNRDAHAAVNSERQMAFDTAMTAMTSAGEQGVVLEFMRNSFLIKDIETLARKVVEAMGSYGLESSVQLRTNFGDLNVSCDEPMSPLEQEFLSKMKSAGRLREKRDYFVANYGDVTLLVKNMPNDEDKRGRLRDHIAILAEGSASRLQAIEIERGLSDVVNSSRSALQKIEAMQKVQKDNAVRIMDEVMVDLEASFMSYGLTEEQEELLLRVVERGVEKSLENLKQGIQVDEQLRSIVGQLEAFDKQ